MKPNTRGQADQFEQEEDCFGMYFVRKPRPTPSKPAHYMKYDYHKRNYYPEIDHKGPVLLLAGISAAFALGCASIYFYMTGG
jgi:hypothetical protein